MDKPTETQEDGITRIPLQRLTKMMVEGENKEVLKYLRSLPKAECAEVKEQLIKNLEALQQQQQKPRVNTLSADHAKDKKPHGTTGRSSGRRDKASAETKNPEKPSVDWAQAQKVVTESKKGESKSVRVKGETKRTAIPTTGNEVPPKSRGSRGKAKTPEELEIIIRVVMEERDQLLIENSELKTHLEELQRKHAQKASSK